MKYIPTLQALLLIGVLTSCQPQDELSADGRALTFHIALEGEKSIQTRAYAGDLNLSTVGFGIVGYKTVGNFTAEPGTAVPNVLSTSEGLGKNVAWLKQKDNKFTIKLPTIGGSSTVDDGETISYFAWSGNNKEADGCGLIGATTDGMAGYPFIDVKLRRANELQADIVAAHAINFPNDYVVTSVDLDFHHLFSKLSFSVKNSTDAKVTITSTKLKFAKERIYSKARYTYDCSDSIGSFGRYSDYHADELFTPNGWKTPEVANSIATLGDLLILPQKASEGFLTLELTYTLASGTSASTITRIVPLKGIDLCQGKNYLYTLNIHAEQVEVINATVGKWNEAPTGSLPLVPGACGDDILLLEGTDAPYPYDGKWYWLDRSGYNNHCEIYTPVSGENTITHDPNKKAYVFGRTGSNSNINNFIKIPKLDNFTGDLTIEMIASTGWTAGIAPTPLVFAPTEITGTLPGNSGGPNRSTLIHMFHENKIYFDYGGTVNTSSETDYERTKIPFSFSADQQRKKAFYTFTRDNTSKVFVRNSGLYYYEEPAKSAFNTKPVPFTYGALGCQWGGDIHYLKISKKRKTFAQIQADYTDLSPASSYDITEDSKNKYTPPVTRGLVLCLDARTGLTSNTWSDISINNNVARVDKSGSGFTFSHVSNVSGTQAIYLKDTRLKLDNGLGTLFNFTLQIVGWSINTDNTILSFQNMQTGKEAAVRQIQVHFPWDSSIRFNAPYSSNGITISHNPSAKSNYTFIKHTGNYMKIRKGVDQAGYTESASAPLQALNYCYIGGQNTDTNEQYFNGYICTIRLYSCVLSDSELQELYEYDVATFGPF